VQCRLNFARGGPLFVAPSTSSASDTEVAVVKAAEAGTSEQDDAVDLSTMDEKPCQPKLGVYAPVSKSKTEKGKLVTKRRDFQPIWFERFPWLEFSVEKKAAFCYCCRHFALLSQGGDTTFIKNGFSDWFHALENKRGLRGHDDSLVHKNAYAMWQERKERFEKNETITALVCDKQLERNRYYVKSIAEVVQFLAINCLSFRGDECA